MGWICAAAARGFSCATLEQHDGCTTLASAIARGTFRHAFVGRRLLEVWVQPCCACGPGNSDVLERCLNQQSVTS